MLASESGVSRRMIVGIEHGARNPGVLSIIDIATALGVNPADLIGESIVTEETTDRT